MTHKQGIVLQNLKQQLLAKVPDGYEFKCYDVEELLRSISVYAELGPPDNKNPIVEALCHFHFIITIGPRGGTKIKRM